MPVPTKAGPNTVCRCGHWWEEHRSPLHVNFGECEGCDVGGTFDSAHIFTFDPEENTPEAIADRGGDPERWPQWVKDRIPVF